MQSVPITTDVVSSNLDQGYLLEIQNNKQQKCGINLVTKTTDG
jgi:hypothetical protein